jgi:hypothetical protein
LTYLNHSWKNSSRKCKFSRLLATRTSFRDVQKHGADTFSAGYQQQCSKFDKTLCLRIQLGNLRRLEVELELGGGLCRRRQQEKDVALDVATHAHVDVANPLRY